jgi:hypothetical protein
MRTTKGIVEINDQLITYKFVEILDYTEVFVQENGNWKELVEDDLEEDSTFKILYELILKVGPKDFGPY